MARITLEIVVESASDAAAATRGGADRLELCAALQSGGLTSSLDLLAAVKRASKLPVMAMIRPRAGDFCYESGEIEAMRRDIDAALERGADGLVFGVLREDAGIDAGPCRDLLARCGSRPAVFHRAFDAAPDPLAALEQLIDLGFTRVLTSGGPSGACDPRNTAVLCALIEQAEGRIEVLPGGGLRPHNVATLVRATGCTQVHSSCRPVDALDEHRVGALRRTLDELRPA